MNLQDTEYRIYRFRIPDIFETFKFILNINIVQLTLQPIFSVTWKDNERTNDHTQTIMNKGVYGTRHQESRTTYQYVLDLIENLWDSQRRIKIKIRIFEKNFFYFILFFPDTKLPDTGYRISTG